MSDVHRPRRVRIVHDKDVRFGIAVIHEVVERFDEPYFRADRPSEYVATACRLSVRRDDTYLADDEAPNCFMCLAREGFHT